MTFPQATVNELKSLIQSAAFRQEEIQTILAAKSEVVGYYQKLFSPERITSLAAEEFQEFLLFKNNKHWNGLHRQGPKMCADMGLLRKALTILTDESTPLNRRLDQLILQNGKTMVPGFGRAVITAILTVCHPDKYGVWNGTVQKAMEKLGLWPKFERGASFGDRYQAVNEVLTGIAKELNIDLWTLDALWWTVISPTETQDKATYNGPTSVRFDFEKQLHDYLSTYWHTTDLAREWVIYEEEGDLIGYEYQCEAGKIDLLARHKEEAGRWLVVELKKDTAGDQTIGQVLRYMGWVKQSLAGETGRVQGLIIAADTDKKMIYALNQVQDIHLLRYEMSFRLMPVKLSH